MKRIAFLIVVLCTAYLVAEKDIPLHQIIELEETPYLVSMIKNNDDTITYRTYPFGAINSPGFYKLANQVTNQISINSSDVTLDLGGQNVSGGIVIQTGLSNVTIKDGTVDVQSSVADAVKINAGCENINLKNLHVQNATVNGILLDQVSESCIKNCEMTSNGTGLQLCNSHNIIIEQCNAVKNNQEGFCLLQSTTCSVLNSTAISTGFGNTKAANTAIMGFSANNGNGNLFKNCTANYTIGPEVIDVASLVAGFVLWNNESCSQIINCSSSNATTNNQGVTSPIGIALEGNIKPTITIAFESSSDVRSYDIAWSPDQKYLAVTNATDSLLQVYEFDEKNSELVVVDEVSYGLPRGVDWSFDSKYLCASANTSSSDPKVRAFKFENRQLTELSFNGTIPTSNTFLCRWANSQHIFAHVSTGSGLFLWKLDPIKNEMNLLTSDSFTGNTDSVSWSYDDKFILAITFPSTKLYAFDGENLTQKINTGEGDLFSVWHPFKYFAVSKRGTSLRIRVWDPENETYTLVTSLTVGNQEGTAAWSPDGKYLAVWGAPSVGTASIYRFDPNASQKLTLMKSFSPVPSSFFFSEWSPDGSYVANAFFGNEPLRIYNIFDNIEQCSVINNSSYCNSGGENNESGFGILGSSIKNLIIQNSSYSNPLSSSASVKQNYVSTLNVFNPFIQEIPSVTQNIGPMAQVPIQAPPDQVLMLKQLNSKLCDIQTKIELLITANL